MDTFEWWQWIASWLALIPLIGLAYRRFPYRHVIEHHVIMTWRSNLYIMHILRLPGRERWWTAIGGCTFGKMRRHSRMTVPGMHPGAVGDPIMDFATITAQRGHEGWEESTYPTLMIYSSLDPDVNYGGLLLTDISNDTIESARTIRMRLTYSSQQTQVLQLDISGRDPAGKLIASDRDWYALSCLVRAKHIELWILPAKSMRGKIGRALAFARFSPKHFAWTPIGSYLQALQIAHPLIDVAARQIRQIGTEIRRGDAPATLTCTLGVTIGGETGLIGRPDCTTTLHGVQINPASFLDNPEDVRMAIGPPERLQGGPTVRIAITMTRSAWVDIRLEVQWHPGNAWHLWAKKRLATRFEDLPRTLQKGPSATFVMLDQGRYRQLPIVIERDSA